MRIFRRFYRNRLLLILTSMLLAILCSRFYRFCCCCCCSIQFTLLALNFFLKLASNSFVSRIKLTNRNRHTIIFFHSLPQFIFELYFSFSITHNTIAHYWHTTSASISMYNVLNVVRIFMLYIKHFHMCLHHCIVLSSIESKTTIECDFTHIHIDLYKNPHGQKHRANVHSMDNSI